MRTRAHIETSGELETPDLRVRKKTILFCHDHNDLRAFPAETPKNGQWREASLRQVEPDCLIDLTLDKFGDAEFKRVRASGSRRRKLDGYRGMDIAVLVTPRLPEVSNYEITSGVWYDCKWLRPHCSGVAFLETSHRSVDTLVILNVLQHTRSGEPGDWVRYLEGGTTANELFGTRRPPEFLVFDCDTVPQPGLMWQTPIFRHDSSFESGRSLDNQRVMGLERPNASASTALFENCKTNVAVESIFAERGTEGRMQSAGRASPILHETGRRRSGSRSSRGLDSAPRRMKKAYERKSWWVAMLKPLTPAREYRACKEYDFKTQAGRLCGTAGIRDMMRHSCTTKVSRSTGTRGDARSVAGGL
ncbi:uncharacterized protein CLUP02_04006 [Colletotrichum lupini]|uniref:Uncharacterized protein n=1 Tax=Colletotrichum lupini TaxID=145971 RepID=A0A9Q8SJI9_9PEZI|nr:uncharacterized protein CLUP02_04006 [Colletotrichum lupini]UQC78529.1 hypothetical protein CLUP02_04006 [Colletotrichum lupini]